ncbi:MAG TPA: YIP1 family protein [Anaeromyxobacter sp.]|nr:YIP1 family protein [Anaeromyxobacter sp.]
MTASEIAADGAVIARTFASPSVGLASAVERRRSATALALGTMAALAFAAAAAPRLDFERAKARELDRNPKAAEMTPHDREEALATARKVGQVATWAAGATQPAVWTLGAALVLFAAFRVAGTRPGFRDAFAVAAHGLLPIWLARLLAVPAVVARAPVQAEDVDRLLPSSAAALLPAGAPASLAGALGGLDLFALWAAALVAAGMARATGAPRRRSAAVVAILYVSWIAVVRVALPALAAAAAAAPKGAS